MEGAGRLLAETERAWGLHSLTERNRLIQVGREEVRMLHMQGQRQLCGSWPGRRDVGD